MSQRSSEICCKPHELDLLKNEGDCDEESSSLIRHGSFNALPPCWGNQSSEHMKSSIMDTKVKLGSLSVQSCRDVSDSEREPLQQRRQTIAHFAWQDATISNCFALKI